MSVIDSTNKVKKNIGNIFDRRIAGVIALALNYCAMALQDFRALQEGGKYWKNQSGQAKDRMFGRAYTEKQRTIIGWIMAHGVGYGPHLEQANNRKHEAIRPTIQKFANPFFEAVKKLYAS